MFRHALATLMAAALTITIGMAADPVPVRGTSAAYAPSVDATVKGQAVRLNLTGVGLRTRFTFNVYAIASYVQDGAAVRTAEDLARADTVRLLHLVMQRTVEPSDFIGAFKAAIDKSHPADEFKAEFTQLATAVGSTAAAKGDHVTLLSLPGEGVRIQVAQSVDVTIKNPAFARALWEVYLGPKPLDEGLKKGMVSMLTR